MPKFFSLLFLIVTLNLYVSAQTTYKPGFILTLEKDTINGFILENTDAELGLKMEFKKELTTLETKTYTPKDLSGFGFNNGRTFEQMLIINNARIPQDTSYVFAKNILKGKITFLVWRKRKTKPDLFLVNNESRKTVHLTEPQKEEITLNDGTKYIKEDVRYIGLLNYIKGDSGNLSKNDRRYINYSENKIGKDLFEYNKKFETAYSVSKYKEPFKYSYNITIDVFLIM
jgi:hypothetical protein